jgi:membrane-bound ClpP family serine protease
MIRLIAVAFALAFATSAQATLLAPLHQPEGMVTQVREACGAGMHMVNGTCVRTAARRNAARCAVGMHTVGGRCVK